MNKKTNGSPGKYPPDLKIAVAREYFSSDLSFRDLGVKYGYSHETIAHFIRWYKGQYPDDTGLITSPAPVSNTPEDKAASKQLAEANLKIAALEMLIQNASKELGVDLVKKHGTKRSAK